MVFRFLVLLAVIGFVPLAQAQDNPYLVPEVTITLDNADPMTARDKALKQAMKEGFTRLLRTLTSRDSWNNLPALVEQTDPAPLLERFSILSETSRPVYKLAVELRFNREQVRALLGKYQIPFSEVGSGTVLLLPLLDMPDNRTLWDETNPWRTVLEQAAGNISLVRFMLPVGDAREMMMLTPEMVAFGASDMIDEIGKYYNARMVVVPRLRLGVADDGSQELVVEAAWYGKTSVPPQTIRVAFDSTLPVAESFKLAAESTLLALEEAWRGMYQLNFDQAASVLVTVEEPTPQLLSDLQKKMAQVPIVRGVRLGMASKAKAILQIDYFGSPERLEELSREQGLNLYTDPMGELQLTVAE